jgi:hypothetical protein
VTNIEHSQNKAVLESHQNVREILKWMIDRTGGELGLPPWDGQRFIAAFAKKTGLAKGTVRNLKYGASAQIKDRTANELAKFFRSAVPQVQSAWFQHMSLQDIIAREENLRRDKKRISLEIPQIDQNRFEVLKHWLCGVYVCYRYGFERSEEGLVAREILAVWEQEGSFRFTMSFVPGGDEHGQISRLFDGLVLPLGESVFFVGWNDARGRSLFVHADLSNETKDCRIGILTSTRLSSNRTPLAACTILIKCVASPTNLGAFMQAATKTSPFDVMVDEDFGGGSARYWMTKFLNNTPLGEQDGHPKPDFVLRIDLFRFSSQMPTIYRSVMANEKIDAPFKPNWKPPTPI